jgi:hypothetical protein
MMNIITWTLKNSLWLVGIGLMLASSGIDGAYMARWMTALPGIGSAALLGYVLNTTSDVASMVLSYTFTRLRHDNAKRTKRARMAWALLVAEFIAVVYSWFFGWRQLLTVLPAVEGDNAQWVAPIAAGFIPVLLAAIGWAQALIAEPEEKPTSEATTKPEPPTLTTVGDDPITERRRELLSLYRAEPERTQASVAEALGVSASTVRNDLAALEADGVIQRNGNGIEVKK